MVILMRMDDKRRQLQKKYRQEIKQKRVDEKGENKEKLLIVTVLFLIIIIIILFQDVFVNPNRIIRIIS